MKIVTRVHSDTISNTPPEGTNDAIVTKQRPRIDTMLINLPPTESLRGGSNIFGTSAHITWKNGVGAIFKNQVYVFISGKSCTNLLQCLFSSIHRWGVI